MGGLNGSFVITLMAKYDFVLLGKQLLSMEDDMQKLNSSLPINSISKQIFAGVTAAF